MKREPPDRPPDRVLPSPHRTARKCSVCTTECRKGARGRAGTQLFSLPSLLLAAVLIALSSCLQPSAATALSDPAMYFDGTAFSYIRTNTIPAGGAFAASFWLYLRNTTGSTPDAILHLGNGNGQDEAVVDVDEVSGKLRLCIRNGDGYTKQLPGHLELTPGSTRVHTTTDLRDYIAPGTRLVLESSGQRVRVGFPATSAGPITNQGFDLAEAATANIPRRTRAFVTPSLMSRSAMLSATWIHVFVQHDGVDRASIYIDGELSAEGSMPVLPSLTVRAYIGVYSALDTSVNLLELYRLEGYLSALQLWSRTLSQAERFEVMYCNLASLHRSSLVFAYAFNSTLQNAVSVGSVSFADLLWPFFVLSNLLSSSLAAVSSIPHPNPNPNPLPLPLTRPLPQVGQTSPETDYSPNARTASVYSHAVRVKVHVDRDAPPPPTQASVKNYANGTLHVSFQDPKCFSDRDLNTFPDAYKIQWGGRNSGISEVQKIEVLNANAEVQEVVSSATRVSETQELSTSAAVVYGSQRIATSCEATLDVQRVSTSVSAGSSLGGVISILFGGFSTNVAFDVSAAGLESALEALQSISGVAVTRTGPYVITHVLWCLVCLQLSNTNLNRYAH